MIWGIEYTKAGRIIHEHCKECKTTKREYGGKGLCIYCYEKIAVTKIRNPKTGKFYIRGERKKIYQKEYDATHRHHTRLYDKKRRKLLRKNKLSQSGSNIRNKKRR
jgi:uncharacterized Zn finger protein (UPF0148 family)